MAPAPRGAYVRASARLVATRELEAGQPAIHPDARIGDGCIVAPGCVIGRGAALGRGVVVGANTVMVQIAGEEEKIDAFVDLVRGYGIKELARTGVIAMPRGSSTVSAPEDTVGDVIGDLNSRRGRPLGMEPVGAGMTEIKAEVPMAEMLSYAPDLRSITGGQGEFTMEFERYEEVPAHLAQKVIDEARAEAEAVNA